MTRAVAGRIGVYQQRGFWLRYFLGNAPRMRQHDLALKGHGFSRAAHDQKETGL